MQKAKVYFEVKRSNWARRSIMNPLLNLSIDWKVIGNIMIQRFNGVLQIMDICRRLHLTFKQFIDCHLDRQGEVCYVLIKKVISLWPKSVERLD